MKTRELFTTITPLNTNRTGFRDLTGAFPQKSSQGKLSFMVVYGYDINAILAEQIKKRHAATTHYDFLNVHKILQSRGSDPKVYIMENNCSSDLK